MPRPLTPKQQRFAEEYLVDLNGAAAYRRAGYRARSDHVASAAAAKLLANAGIAAAITAAQAVRSSRTRVDADYVVTRLKAEAETAGKGSNPIARVKALELLGKHLGLFTDRLRAEIGVQLQIVEEIVDADSRPEGDPPAPGPA